MVLHGTNGSNDVKLECDANGNLLVSTQRTENVLAFNTLLTGSQLYGVGIDCTGHKSLRLLGEAQWAFNIYGSTDEIHWYKIDVVNPDPTHSNHYHYYLDNPPKYIRIKNGGSSNTITMYYSLIN